MKRMLLLILLSALSGKLFAVPITYYDLDFEDGNFGGGIASSGPVFTSPSNVSTSTLDGKALQFDLDNQMQWALNGPDSPFHYVSFDVFVNPGAKVTQFLDVPSILRTDTTATGRHNIEILYDFAGNTALTYIDGVLDSALLTSAFWPIAPGSPMSNGIRIANQTGAPGVSTASFQLDNLVWRGDTTAFTVNSVTSPSGFAVLIALSLIGMLAARRK